MTNQEALNFYHCQAQQRALRILMDSQKWVTAFAYGWGCLRSHFDEYAFVNGPRWYDLKIQWNAGYGVLNVDIVRGHRNALPDPDILCRGERLNSLQVLGRSESSGFAPRDIYNISQIVDRVLLKGLSGIQQENSVEHCHVCSLDHSARHRWHLGQIENSVAEPMVTICKPIAGRWLCEYCEPRYCLTTPTPVETGKKRKSIHPERTKMTPSLRFQILERDKFRCTACGASPLTDDKTVLHVDHIIPIAEGGLTVLENLHTLCQPCNAGKSARIIGAA